MSESSDKFDFPAPEIEHPPQEEDLDFSDNAWGDDDLLEEDLELLNSTSLEEEPPATSVSLRSGQQTHSAPDQRTSTAIPETRPPPPTPSSPKPRPPPPTPNTNTRGPPPPPPGPRPPSSNPPSAPRGPPPPPRPPPPPPTTPSPKPPATATKIVADEPTASDNELALQTTPAHSSPSSKFAFLSEEKAVPTQLHRMEETSVRRRHEFQSNVHDLECRVASLTATLAQEQMDRNRSLTHVLSDAVYKKLEEAAEEVYLNTRDKRPSHNWIKLEARLSQLDMQMTHSVHVGLENEQRSRLLELQDELEHYAVPAVKLEMQKADKREGALVRRWEELVGLMARRFHEEHAARLAAMEAATQQLRVLEGTELTEAYLEKILALKGLLNEETEARKASDARIQRLIARREALMKEAMLESVGDSVEAK